MSKFSISYGCGSSLGARSDQQDRLVAVKVSAPNVSNKHYFAVYDGHGGDKCSSFLAANLHSSVTEHSMFHEHPNVALKEVWAKFDNACYNEFYRLVTVKGLKSLPFDGSTATVCMISDTDVFIANCGDSAAYAIFPDGKSERLTEDHGTFNTDEVDRCVKTGGALVAQSYSTPWGLPFCCMESIVATKPRMMPGNLLVTRSFGNFHAKLEHLGGQKGVILHSHGEVKQLSLATAAPKYIVLASDGIWDVLRIDEVMALIEDVVAGGDGKNIRRLTSSSTRENSVNGTANAAATTTTTTTTSAGPPKSVKPVTSVSVSHVNVTTVVPEPVCNEAFYDVEAANLVPAYGPQVTSSSRAVPLGAAAATGSGNKLANASRSELLTRAANAIIDAAVGSHRWELIGRSADNASVTIISLDATSTALTTISN
jgi:serine/threonine protein phosphatase PrpC